MWTTLKIMSFFLGTEDGSWKPKLVCKNFENKELLKIL